VDIVGEMDREGQARREGGIEEKEEKVHPSQVHPLSLSRANPHSNGPVRERVDNQSSGHRPLGDELQQPIQVS
jgi:hypothetical protein